jgi:hypothetical protein
VPAKLDRGIEVMKEKIMVAVPIPRTGQPTQLRSLGTGAATPSQSADWTHLLAAGTVVAGGALMIAGHKKAGLAVAAAGTALVLLEEPEVLDKWWKSLPAYLAEAQGFLDKIEGYLNEASAQGHRIQSILRR